MTAFCFFGCEGIREKKNNNTPSIDFMQTWAFYDMTEEQLDKHFSVLKNNGIDTVIIQSLANFNNGEAEVCYYDSDMSFKYNDGYFLQNALSAAKKHGIKIIAGLSSDDYWWSFTSHGYSDEAMKKFYSQDLAVLNEILEKYEINGVYYSYEMFSNPLRYEKTWAEYLNKIISFLNDTAPDLPLYISPYNYGAFLQTDNSKARMWERFFKKVEFREGDCFLLQDGFGALRSSPTEKEGERVFELNKKIMAECEDHSKAEFYLNVELFAKDGYASDKRIKKQISYANRLGNKMACFSYSHYMGKVEILY